MSYYYPQGAVKLSILPEDFKLTSDAATQRPYELIVQARNVTVSINDYKTTDTFSMEIDFKHFPFDPRTIRACGVVIHMQDMESVYDGAQLNTIVPSEDNAVLSGFVDQEDITFDENKRTVKFEGRDFTALLIDQKYIENRPISLNQPVETVLTQLLATFKATKEIKLVNLSGQNPTLAQYYPDFGSPQAGQKNVGAHESYWEIIQDIANRAGLVCYLHLDTLILTTPKNQANTVNDDIKFIYGQNVKNLNMKRKLGRFKGFNLQVRSRAGKQVLIAKIPEQATRKWGESFGFQYQPTVSVSPTPGAVSQNFAPVTIPVLKPDGSLADKTNNQPAPYISFNVPNISNLDQLIRNGQTLYEQYSLQQLEGSFDTFEMIGKGQTKDSNSNDRQSFKSYDLTQISKGQTISIEIGTDDLAGISRLGTVDQRTQYLTHKNYSKEVASIFAKTMGRFSPRFFIKNYSLTLNQDTGFKLHVEFINVIDLTQRGLA